MHYHFSIQEIPDSTHYKYVSTYEGAIKEHIFLRAEHFLRIISNFKADEITLAIRYTFDPKPTKKPQDRMRIYIDVRSTENISPTLVNQIVQHGPLAEFYTIDESDKSYINWNNYKATSEIVRFEEHFKPSNPPGLDIHKLNELIPESYHCIYPFKPRLNNDFLMIDKCCSFLKEPAVLEIILQPTSQQNELDNQYREIVRLMAVNSYSRGDYIVDSNQLDPFKDLYEPKTIGEREIRAKDPMADDFLRIHRDFHKVLRKPQVLFNIKSWAKTQETAHLIASTAAECGFLEGSYRILDYDSKSEWYKQSLDASKQLSVYADACFFKYPDSSNNKCSKLTHMSSVDEFKGIFRLPVAGYSPLCCLWKSTDYHRKLETKNDLILGHVLNVGDKAKSVASNQGSFDEYLDITSPSRVPVTMPVELLTKHMFVSGVPGSGKTTAVINILVQLFKKGVPFLVIEPGKSEYRRLKMLHDHPDPIIQKMSKSLRIYTPGKDDVSPFRFNPFQFPEGNKIDEHISQLLTCFEASMPLGGPLQALLAESIEAVYNMKTINFPAMTDLVDVARQIMEEKGYAGEVRSNLSAAIEVRLSSLTRLTMGSIFQCDKSIPSIENLLKYPTIIEIQNLNAYQACLLSLFILSAIWQEIKLTRPYSKELKHVTIIEEAHNIVARSDPAKPSEEFADPKAYAADYVVKMLAEIRALGEGIIIADQLPSAVASSVVKNTGTKLAHRLVSLIDRKDLGGAMLLQEPQMEEIARLEPGQAYYYSEGLYAPRHIIGLNVHDFLRFNKTEIPNNQGISSIVEQEFWFINSKKERYAYLVNLLSGYHKNLDQAITASKDDLRLYDEDYKRIKKAGQDEDIFNQLINLRSEVIKSRKIIKRQYLSMVNFVQSIPKDIINNLQEPHHSIYMQLIKGPFQKLNKSASDLDFALEKLRSKLTNALIKGSDEHGNKRN